MMNSKPVAGEIWHTSRGYLLKQERGWSNCHTGKPSLAPQYLYGRATFVEGNYGLLDLQDLAELMGITISEAEQHISEHNGEG